MSKNDKELLELAARAVKLDAFWSVDGSFVVKSGGGMGTMPFEHEWNPLKNDGDALRLAVALRFRIDHLYRGMQCVMVGNGDTWALQFYNGDATNATRLAIVKAAAQIGATL